MRFAVIADVHGNLPALEKVWQDIRKRNIDLVFCAGDLVGHTPFPNKVIEFIQAKGIQTVQGNYDESIGFDRFVCGCDFKTEEDRIIGEGSLNWTKKHVTKDNKAFLQSLPKEIRLTLCLKKVLITHGSPYHQNEYLFEDTDREYLNKLLVDSDTDVLICGHTHLPYHLSLEKGHIINAGSVGKPKHGNPEATYVTVHLSDDKVVTSIHYIPYDYEKTAQAIEACDIPNQLAVKIRKGNA